ncbi:MAG: hypothetical protein EBU88_14025, partial [Acidobacteria bacterium]|nr:hypothetical protein [Acidobacteriota bacterium]
DENKKIFRDSLVSNAKDMVTMLVDFNIGNDPVMAQAARQLEQQAGVRARVLDLRWLNPLPMARIHQHAADCNGVLVVDECRATGAGIADAVIASLAESGYQRPLSSVRAVDTYVPLAAAANLVLVSTAQIVEAALVLTRRSSGAGDN